MFLSSVFLSYFTNNDNRIVNIRGCTDKRKQLLQETMDCCAILLVVDWQRRVLVSRRLFLAFGDIEKPLLLMNQ